MFANVSKTFTVLGSERKRERWENLAEGFS
jgi:hypothetical protein